MSLRSIPRAVKSLRTTEPGTSRPVTDARLGVEGYELVARQDEGCFDPVTGLRLLDFALSLKPDFAEAHFNLATALTEIGQKEKPRARWRRYGDVPPACLRDPGHIAPQPPSQRCVVASLAFRS